MHTFFLSATSDSNDAKTLLIVWFNFKSTGFSALLEDRDEKMSSVPETRDMATLFMKNEEIGRSLGWSSVAHRSLFSEHEKPSSCHQSRLRQGKHPAFI